MSTLSGRLDPPESKWAGELVTEDDVAMACGDELTDMRLRAHRDALTRYNQALPRSIEMTSEFKFAQIMLDGDMYDYKIALACFEAYRYFKRGHMVFHNGPLLFGRKVSGPDIYDLAFHMPRSSVVLIDYAHAGLEPDMAMSIYDKCTAVLCTGLRKKNCRLLLVPTADTMVPRRVRDMTSEVWRPVLSNIHRTNYDYKMPLPGQSDPAYVMLYWDIWRDFPYRGRDIISCKGRKKGFGPPDDKGFVMGELLRNAVMLTRILGAKLESGDVNVPDGQR